MDREGTSLIELICAVILVILVVVTLSTTFPRASSTIAKNRQRWTAGHLANNQIASLTGEPYDSVAVTEKSYISDPSCECSRLSPAEWAALAALNPAETQTAGAVFSLATCVHYVVPGTIPWGSQCPGPGFPDPGFKQVLVRVIWSTGGDMSTLTQEALITRP